VAIGNWLPASKFTITNYYKKQIPEQLWRWR